MHTHIYTMHKRRLRWNSHLSPPLDLSHEKHCMVWVEIKVPKENMMNSTKCWRELEWALAWGKRDGIHHYNYHKTTSNQHRLSSNIPDMDSQMEESKFGGWQGAQFLKWSQIVCLLAPCNSNTPKGLIVLILKIVQSEEMSRESLGCR
jgi:hypothetical protein